MVSACASAVSHGVLVFIKPFMHVFVDFEIVVEAVVEAGGSDFVAELGVFHYQFHFIEVFEDFGANFVHLLSDLLFEDTASRLKQQNLPRIKQRQHPSLEILVVSLDAFVRTDGND